MKAGRIILLILGIIMALTGVYCLFTPTMTYLSVGYIVGLNMALDAFGGIVTWSERRAMGMADGWTLAGAVASLAFGVLLLGSAGMQFAVDMMIIYIAAFWLIVIGVIRVIYALQIRRIRQALDAEIFGGRWPVMMILGILLIVGGVFSLFNPSGLMIAIGINFGLCILAAGAHLIALAV